MNAALILSMLELGIGLVERLAPEVARLVRSGEITAEQQKALQERVAKLRQGGGAFSGPEWEVVP